MGNVVSTSESNTYDGLFYSVPEGRLKYRHVSAVVFYQYLSGGEHHTSTLRVYHNPYGTNPLDRSTFADNDQFIKVADGPNESHMEWLAANSTF